MTVQRRGRRADAAHSPIPQLPWSQPRLTLEPSRIVSDDQIEMIHRQSLKVLEEIGMDMIYPEARQIFARAGARIDGERVRIGRDIVGIQFRRALQLAQAVTTKGAQRETQTWCFT